MIQVSAPSSLTRSEIQAMIDPFRADVVDVGLKTIVVQVAGSTEKVNACIDVLRPYGIKQLARNRCNRIYELNARSIFRFCY